MSESAADEAQLAQLTKRYGAPVAVLRGDLIKQGNSFVFTEGSAMLSPTVSATWDKAGGELSVSTTGVITQNGISLSAPTFKFYKPKAGKGVVLQLTANPKGLAATLDPDNNDAIISIDIPYAKAQLESVVVYPDGNLKFGGEISLTTLFNGAALSLEELGYGLKDGLYKVSGVKASGSLDSAALFNLELAEIEGSINTFPGEEEYHFEMELNVYEIFKAEAELTLKRFSATGVLMPDDLFFYLEAEPGVPLVPPVVVARLKGGGAGFYDLADTVNGDFFAIPPIRLRGDFNVSMLNFLDARASVVFGPGYYSKSLSEIKLSGTDELDVIKKFTTYMGMQGQTRVYSGKSYTGLLLSAGVEMEANFPSMENDWIIVGGALNFGAFAGLDNYDSPQEVYLLIGGNGKIYGSLQFPSEWSVIGGMTILGADIEAALGVQTLITVNEGWEKALTSIYNNADIYFGVVANVEVIGTKVRVWYVLPPDAVSDYGVTIKTPGFSMPEWNWGDHGITTFSAAAALTNSTGSQIGLMAMESSLPQFSSSDARPVFASVYSEGVYTETVTFSAGDSTAGDSLYILIQPDDAMTDAEFEDFKDSLNVTGPGGPLTLNRMEDVCDEPTPAALAAVNAAAG